MTRRYTFSKAQRLGGRGTFAAIRDKGLKQTRGPLVMWTTPCDARKSRLGISIGRMVGNAVRRNRIKRLLREAFRLLQHDIPASYDIVLTVRPHEPLILAEYQRLLSHMLVRAHGHGTSGEAE